MMKLDITKKIVAAIALLSLTAFTGEVNAQCLTASNGQYPADYFPTCTGTVGTIASDCYAGEYSVVNVTAGVQYTFSSSINTDYLTISNLAGTTALTSGTTPVVWTATVSGNVRFYTHTNAACGEAAVSRARRVLCNSSVPVPGCTTNIFPQNGQTGISPNPAPVFTWNALPNASAYNFYFGTTAVGATLLGTSATSNIAITGCAPNTTYFWYVVPVNASGAATGCATNVTSFTTGLLSNDNCSGAIAINALSGAITGTTNGATQSMPGGACEGATSSQARDVWYSVTADFTGNIDVIADESIFGSDMVWEAYSGTCASLSAAIACSDDVGGFTIAATAGQTYYIRVYRYGSTSAGNFAMQVAGTALPVTMDKLKGQIDARGLAQLSWKTLSEQNNKGFQIQRSADGSNFSTVGFVGSQAANGNSRESIGYNFTDMNAVNGTAYYRLQQTDIDGKTVLSNTVRLTAKEKGMFEIVAVPNPVKDKVSIKTYGERGNQARIQLSDISGKVVRQLQITADETEIDMSSVSGGIYLLKYTDANRTETIKVSKQ